jgi:hypothetical protein
MPIPWLRDMQRAHIDISRGLDGELMVLACLELREDELAAAGRAVASTVAERYRTQQISADDVLELRELTALVDELDHGSRRVDPNHGVDPDRGSEPKLGTEPNGGGEPSLGVEQGLAIRTLVLRPARLSALRDAIASFVESRDEADWVGHEDREPLSLLRDLVFPLEQLCADAMRAALSPESHVR